MRATCMALMYAEWDASTGGPATPPPAHASNGLAFYEVQKKASARVLIGVFWRDQAFQWTKRTLLESEAFDVRTIDQQDRLNSFTTS